MKKTTIALFVSLLALSSLFAGCGKKYSDVTKANNEFVELVEDYVADLEKVDNAAAAAKALNAFADGMETIMPKLQSIMEKYPELEDESDENLPEELKEVQAQAEAAAQKMMGSMMKIMPYMQDPEVMKAQQRLGTIMSE